MSLGQGEKVVTNLIGSPAGVAQIVTFLAIGGETGLLVIRVGSSGIILPMTVYAVIAYSFKLQSGSIYVALIAV